MNKEQHRRDRLDKDLRDLKAKLESKQQELNEKQVRILDLFCYQLHDAIILFLIKCCELFLKERIRLGSKEISDLEGNLKKLGFTPLLH